MPRCHASLIGSGQQSGVMTHPQVRYTRLERTSGTTILISREVDILMLKNGFRWFLAAFLLVGANSGFTQSQIRMLGFDDNSCQAWVSSKEDPEQRKEYVSWARGFLSGHNYANQKQQISDVSRSTVEMYVERFCRDKPTAQFTEAVYRMSDQYSGRSAPITR